jgi:GNAT superfamily N-acetyltransferase
MRGRLTPRTQDDEEAAWDDPAVGSVLVRAAGEQDLESLLGLYRELAEGEVARMPADAPDARPVLTEICRDRSHHICVAVDDGEVVGAAELVVVAKLTHHARPWAVIENVIVTEPARSNGAGIALLDHLVELARGCAATRSSCIPESSAPTLYRRQGFLPIAEGFKLYL